MFLRKVDEGYLSKKNLATEIREYGEMYYPLHMPGHKGGRLTFIEDLHKLDVTETAFTDDLYVADGIVGDALARLRDFYGTKATYFLTNGSTVGVISALSIHRAGEKVLLVRGAHKSVYNAIDLFGLEPVFLEEKTYGDISTGLDLEEMGRLLKTEDIVSVVITSPTYEGVVYDIEAIAELCKKHGAYLIVDEAHGAHLPFFDPSLSAVSYADIVVQSMHKTLPAITGSGLVHVNNDSLVEPVFRGLKIFQTSSPSYIMMCEMDRIVELLSAEARRGLGADESTYISDFLRNMSALKVSLKGLDNISLLDEMYLDSSALAIDVCKITLLSKSNGFEIEKGLLERGFVLEMACRDYIIAIFTIADKREVFERFELAIKEIDASLKESVYEEVLKNKETLDKGFKTGEVSWIDLGDVLGKTSADKLIPYPPGIPIILDGEVFNERVIAKLREYLYAGKSVYGVENNKVKVYV